MWLINMFWWISRSPHLRPSFRILHYSMKINNATLVDRLMQKLEVRANKLFLPIYKGTLWRMTFKFKENRPTGQKTTALKWRHCAQGKQKMKPPSTASWKIQHWLGGASRPAQENPSGAFDRAMQRTSAGYECKESRVEGLFSYTKDFSPGIMKCHVISHWKRGSPTSSERLNRRGRVSRCAEL